MTEIDWTAWLTQGMTCAEAAHERAEPPQIEFNKNSLFQYGTLGRLGPLYVVGANWVISKPQPGMRTKSMVQVLDNGDC
jgi:hypothetical protein